MTNPQALAGIRVVDLSGTIAGWITGMLLGDFGAEVVHVPPPSRSGAEEVPGEAMWHRNKVCASVDWSSPENVATVRRLVAGADVCITTDLGIVDLLGLDESRCGRLVHVSMPSGVPLAAGGVELNALLGALSGVARRFPSFGGGPIDLVSPQFLYTQGLWAATTAVAALFERELSGFGQCIEVDGFHGVMTAATAVMVLDSTLPPMDTATGPGGRTTACAPYRCADGKWLLLAALGRFLRIGFEALGVGHILEDPRIAGEAANLDTPENRPWVKQALADAFATKPRQHWLTTLEAAGCTAAAVEARDQWLDHPQVVALDQRKSVIDPIHGEVVMGGLIVDLTATPGREPEPRRIVPVIELPYWASRYVDTPALARLPADHGPLHGVRVIDLGLYFAGPYAGQLLAELGADVAKIERREGNNSRDGAYQITRGQRSLAINLHDPAGQSAVHRLVAKTDIVIDNYRPGILSRLKMDHETLKEIRPEIISLSITSFGSVGPLAGAAGMDPVLQAMSGMMLSQGGDDEPTYNPLGITDFAGAHATAFASVLALLHRARTGEGQAGQTTLTAGSVFMQSGELVRYRGRPLARLGGRDYVGPSAFDRYYATADGFVRVYTTEPEAFVRAGLLAGPVADAAAAAADIQAGLVSLTRAEALQRLTNAGITAVAARSLDELLADQSLCAKGYLAGQESIEGRTVYLPHRLARFSRTQNPVRLGTPGIGEHSRELLAEAGLSAEEIDAAITSRLVVEGPPVLWFSPAAGQF